MTVATTRAHGGPFLPLHECEWMPEVRDVRTPEELLIEAQEASEDDDDADEHAAIVRALERERLHAFLGSIPTHEAVAFALHLGLLGYPPMPQVEIAELLGVRSQQVVSYLVRRARTRLTYLATRPEVDLSALERVLSPSRLAVVRDVYETTSFSEVARRRWPCPEDKTPHQRHVWTRTRANKIKREFFRAIAKVEKVPELADQALALRHLAGHLGMLAHHAGKGSWWQGAARGRSKEGRARAHVGRSSGRRRRVTSS